MVRLALRCCSDSVLLTSLFRLDLFFFIFTCFLERVVIHVPSNDVPFSVAINSCRRTSLSEFSCPRDRLIGMTDTVQALADLVFAELSVVTTADIRSRPLMISRLARGGKTTTLSFLFDELQFRGVHVMFITFNGSSNFKTRPGESQCNCILRVVASQLVDIGNRDPIDIECGERELDHYIGDLPFVLLIDELNALATPVDAEAGYMLRRLFLDKHNRSLVFTTHVPFSLDSQASRYTASARTPPSPRGCFTVPFHPTLDIESLREMSSACSALTPAEVVLYGGIPSLIYSVKALHEMNPEERFRRKLLHE